MMARLHSPRIPGVALPETASPGVAPHGFAWLAHEAMQVSFMR